MTVEINLLHIVFHKRKSRRSRKSDQRKLIRPNPRRSFPRRLLRLYYNSDARLLLEFYVKKLRKSYFIKGVDCILREISISGWLGVSILFENVAQFITSKCRFTKIQLKRDNLFYANPFWDVFALPFSPVTIDEVGIKLSPR